MRTPLLAALGALLVAGPALSAARAQGIQGLRPTPEEPPTRQGTRGSNFLHLPVGARGTAMGSAVGASTHGPMAWYWNPAGASSSDGFSVAAGLQNLYDDLDLRQTYAAASLPLLGGVVGVSVNSLSSGDIDRTTTAAPFGDVALGRSFRWTSTAVSLGYARRLTDRLSIGALGKYIAEGITDANTTWIAFDLGTQFQTGIYGLVIGGALQHMGGSARSSGSLIGQRVNTPEFNPQVTEVDLSTRRTELPTTFRFSVGEDLFGGPESLFGRAGGHHSLYAEAAVNDAVDLATQLGFGLEYGFRNTFFLRGGKRFYNDDRDAGDKQTFGLSGGFGFRIPVAGRDMRFDYSYLNTGDLQNIQVFSFQFGR